MVSEAAAKSSEDTQPRTSASPELQAALDAIEQRGIRVKEPTAYKGGLKYILSACLFNRNHGGDTSVALIEYPNRAKQYSCLHTECKACRWGDVLLLLELKKSDDKKAAAAEQPLKCPIDQLPSVQSFVTQEVKFVIPDVIPEGTITVIS